MKTATEARLDVLQAALVALAASLPPEHSQLARQLFSVGIADLEEQGELSPAADEVAAGAVAALLAAFGPSA